MTAQDEHQKKTLSDRPKIDFWSILASNLEPKSGQDLPTWSQDRPKMLQIGANMSPRPLTGNEDGPKRPPRSLMGPILVDFGLQFNDFCPHVGRFWTPVNDKEVNKSSKQLKQRHKTNRQVFHHHHHQTSLVRAQRSKHKGLVHAQRSKHRGGGAGATPWAY